MVVPVRSSYTMDKVEERIGNNLKLNINHNDKTLVVVGNNCNIQLSKNSGLVRVVGNTCELSVQNGNGSIEYVGNSGRIIIGSDVPEGNVSYVGNNGVITNMTNTTSTKTSDTKDCKFKLNRRDLPNNLQISGSNNITINNEIGTESFADVMPLTISSFRVRRYKNQPNK